MPADTAAAGPSDHHHRRHPPREPPDEDVSGPTNTLWVGSLPSDAVDPDLMALFGPHGALDCVTMHTTRNYAFVNFRTADDARAAMDALQGRSFRGSHIKIQFARPAKSSRFLWIGGISLSASKEQLEDEFLKFGKLEDYRFFRERNSALVDFYKIGDAIAAQKHMNGKRVAGEQLRVDFQRPPPLRKDLLDHHDPRDGYFRSAGPQEQWMPGSKRHEPYGGQRDGPPSKVLWIGYPPSVRIDEQMLHNAMILFGEIERIKCFSSRNYSFVEFRSIDEARRAKEGLQGRLFNDPRINIMFSSSAAPKDNPPSFSGIKGPRPDMLFNDASFVPFEIFIPGHPMAQKNLSGLLPLPGPNMLMRPFPPQGIDPHHGGSEFHEFGNSMHTFPDGDFNNHMPPNWRRRSPSVSGMLPGPGMQPPFHSGPGTQLPFRPLPGEWDGFDMREAKRSRINGSPVDDPLFHARRVNGKSSGEFGYPHPDRGAMDRSQHNRAVRGHSQMQGSSDNDQYWRGILSKGGTDVCRARCVPLGKGIDSPLPETINCSARTGLDMLTKHYAEASGFDVVFFLPDSEEDFAAYTEFLRYLGDKNRAGVAKLDDGTTLFLVPPSDFLSKVLNVSGPERLYGVVLKFPQQPTSSETQPPQLAIPPPRPHYMDQQQVYDSQKGYSFAPQSMDKTSNVDFGRPLHEESIQCARVEYPPHGVEPYVNQSSSKDYVSKPAATSQVEVSLTPELLATLASLIPSNLQPGATGTNPMPLSSSVHDGTIPSQGWRQEHQVTVPGISLEQPSHPPQQLGYQYTNQVPEHQVSVPGVSLEQSSHPPQQIGYQYANQGPPVSQFQMYTNVPNVPDHSAQSALGSTQFQGPSLNTPQTAAIPTMQSNNYAIASQGEQFLLPQSNQSHQPEHSFASQNTYGMQQAEDAGGVYAPMVQQLNPNTSSAPVQIEQPPQTVMSLPTDQVNLGFQTQGQQLQAVLSSLGQGTSEGDADKNQRYQSTLQFAANLLQQLQQQQQASGQAVQGYANQQ